MTRMDPQSMHGLTLAELAATLAIVAMLSVIAVPGFKELRQSSERRTVVNDFVRAVFLARSEAIKRNSVVSICRSSDGVNCANKAPNWNGGWIVFENSDGDQPAVKDGKEPLLWRRAGFTIGVLTSNRVSFSFRPFGQADVNGTVVYCPANGDPKAARAIIINHTGRPRISDRDVDGKLLKC